MYPKDIIPNVVLVLKVEEKAYRRDFTGKKSEIPF